VSSEKLWAASMARCENLEMPTLIM